MKKYIDLGTIAFFVLGFIVGKILIWLVTGSI